MVFFNNRCSLFASKTSERNMMRPSLSSRALIPTSQKILGIALVLTVVIGVLACTNPLTIIPGVALVLGGLGISKAMGIGLAIGGGTLGLSHVSFCSHKINKAEKVIQAIGLPSASRIKKAIEDSIEDSVDGTNLRSSP